MCSDSKKNLFIERNTQLLRMANEDMYLFKKMVHRLCSSKHREIEEDNHVSNDKTVNGQPGSVCQKYIRVDKHTLDYLKSEHTLTMQNSTYV